MVKKVAKSRSKKSGSLGHWIHAEEEIIIAGGGLFVIVMIMIFLF